MQAPRWSCSPTDTHNHQWWTLLFKVLACHWEQLWIQRFAQGRFGWPLIEPPSCVVCSWMMRLVWPTCCRPPESPGSNSSCSLTGSKPYTLSHLEARPAVTFPCLNSFKVIRFFFPPPLTTAFLSAETLTHIIFSHSRTFGQFRLLSEKSQQQPKEQQQRQQLLQLCSTSFHLTLSLDAALTA